MRPTCPYIGQPATAVDVSGFPGLQFVAIQEIAKWLHPDLFKDVDPGATMKVLHERFLPLPYEPGLWVSLEAGK